MMKETVKDVTLEQTVFYEILEHYQFACGGEVHYLSALVVQIDWAKCDMQYMHDGDTVYYVMSLDGLQIYATYESLCEDLSNHCIDDSFAAYEVHLHNGIFTLSYLLEL